jgi:hypothetical protein
MDEVPDLMSEPPPPLEIVRAPQEDWPATTPEVVMLQGSAAGPTAEQPLSSYTEAETAATTEAAAAAEAEAASISTAEADNTGQSNGKDPPPPDAADMRCVASMQSPRQDVLFNMAKARK